MSNLIPAVGSLHKTEFIHSNLNFPGSANGPTKQDEVVNFTYQKNSANGVRIMKNNETTLMSIDDSWLSSRVIAECK